METFVKTRSAIPKNIDEYIAGFPEVISIKLEQLRHTINKAAPDAKEMISYGMPAFKYHGILVYFAAYKNHIGFYATPTGHSVFKKDLVVYKQGKGSVQFPFDKELPLSLVSKIVKFRVKQNLEKEKGKKSDSPQVL